MKYQIVLKCKKCFKVNYFFEVQLIVVRCSESIGFEHEIWNLKFGILILYPFNLIFNF